MNNPTTTHAAPVAPSPQQSWLRRAWRLVAGVCFPSFATCAAISLAALITIFAWMFSDASFLLTYSCALSVLISGRSYLDHNPALAWDQYGSPVALLGLICGVGLLAAIGAFARVVVGRKGGRTLRHLLAFVAIIGVWLAMFVNMP
jgi:hypothetical protein